MSWSRITLLGFMLLVTGTALLGEDRPAPKKGSPLYPELAKRMRISGAVKMTVDVDPEGKVKDVIVVQGHALLKDAAVNAARQWIVVNAPSKATELIEVDFKE